MGTKKGEERQRKRRMERQEEERIRAYIKAVFSDICALGVERHYEYQYEPMERKHFFFLTSHWAIHAHKKSIQVSVMASLWACAQLCEQRCLASTFFPLMSVARLVLLKNTLRQVQLWWTLQYVNQTGLNACMSWAWQHQSATPTYQQLSLYSFLCVCVCFHTASLLLSVLRDIESKGCKSTHFLPPLPHLQT